MMTMLNFYPRELILLRKVRKSCNSWEDMIYLMLNTSTMITNQSVNTIVKLKFKKSMKTVVRMTSTHSRNEKS